MIDVHSHILPGIDDGSQDIEESLSILNKLKEIGFTDVIITPHYIEGTSYNSNNKEKKELLNELQKKVDLNLYLGNEVYIFNDIIEYIEKKEIHTLNGTDYLLMELPFENEISSLDMFIFKLMDRGVKLIIAHPERYAFLQKNPKSIVPLIEQGVIFQSNYASITERYGKEAKKTLIYFLKHNYIHLLGTDIHHQRSSFYEKFPKMKKAIIKIIGKEKWNELTYINPKKVLNNEEI